MANPYAIEPKFSLWSGRPDAFARDYDPDLFQPWRPEDGMRIKPAAWAAEGFREITDIEEGFSVVIGDIRHLEDTLQQRKGQTALNFHFRLTGNSAIEVEGEEPFMVQQQSLILLLSPDGIEKSERFFSGEHEQSVTLCCQPEFILRRFHDGGGKMPQVLKSCLDAKFDHPIFASTSLNVQMAAAVRTLVHNEFEQEFRRNFVEAKALELIVYSLSALFEMEERLERGEPQIGQRDKARVEAVRSILDETFLDPPVITKLAREVGVNEAKLMHLFKYHVGETIFNYAQRLKMEHAKRLLETSEDSITEIAFEVGYEYSSNFTTAFRRHFGVTPKTAREAAQR